MISNAIIPAKKAQIQFYDEYVQDLKYAIGYYTSWVPREFSDLVSESDGYEMLKNDEKVRQSMTQLALFAAGEKTRIICEDERIQVLAGKFLSNIERYNHAKKSAVFQSTLFGLSLQKIEWEKRRFRNIPGEWVVPKKIVECDKRRLRIERSNENRNHKYWTIWDDKSDEYLVMVDRNDYPNYQGPRTQDYLWVWYEQEEMEPYYRGLSHVLFRMVYTKSFILQYWHELCETCSKPWIHVEADSSKGGFDDSPAFGMDNWQTRVENIVNELGKHKARHILVTDKDADKLTIHENGSIGANILEQYLRYADEMIVRNIMGEEIVGHKAAGSFNLATIKREAIDAFVVDARYSIQEAHERQLLQECFWRNRKNLAVLGIPFPEPGEVKVEFYIESEEIKEAFLSDGLSESRKQRSRANV